MSACSWVAVLSIVCNAAIAITFMVLNGRGSQ